MAAGLVWAGPARSGSFLLEPGAWQMIHSLTVTTSNSAYGALGAPAPETRYRKIEAGLLLERGLTRDVTLLFNPVVREVALGAGSELMAGHGLSSFDVGARWRLIQLRGGDLSFQASTRVPAKSDPAFWLENRPRTDLRMGYGFPATIRGKPGFVDAAVTWAKRHEERADEVKFEMTYGWWRFRDRMILMQYFTTLYPGSGLKGAPWQHKIQTSTVHRLNDRWSVQLGSFYTRGGRLTRRERGTVMAVWRTF